MNRIKDINVITNVKVISIILFILIFLCGGAGVRCVLAFSINSDPQYIVINFANMYYHNWQSSEQEWNTIVKPKIKTELRKWKEKLTIGTSDRRLAWSALLEYMDFPTDIPSSSSAYVIQVKRIMEVAEEENLPVFIPLNGVQWWDNQPELWNYWDFDGNQTPGCTNNNYANCAFKKLRNLVYRQRFIAGYNPENKRNVDWKNWEEPMRFNTRNWGDGDILVAPPPNIVSEQFTRVQRERFSVIIDAIVSKAQTWSDEKKDYLFAGVSIGTEVTLNAAVTPGDENYKPYGFRALQDVFCPKNNPTCGKEKQWSQDELNQMRKTVINRYFTSLVHIASVRGIPKQRLYTHVWSEAGVGELRYTDAIGGSITLFSRPGMSIYGKAENPTQFSLLKNAIITNGYIAWSAPEFSPLIKDSIHWQTALQNTLENAIAPAKLIDIYNERDIEGSAAINPIKNILQKQTIIGPNCQMAEAIGLTENRAEDPKQLSWSILNSPGFLVGKQTVLIWKNFPPKSIEDPFTISKEVDSDKTSIDITGLNLKPGLYWWVTKNEGCPEKRYTTSAPRYFLVNEKKVSAYTFLNNFFFSFFDK